MRLKILFPRRIPEHRNPALVTATLCLCTVWVLVLGETGAFRAGPRAFMVGMAVAVAPLLVYVPLALLVDRYEKEPRWMLATAFLWGAVVAVFLATVFNPSPRVAYASVKGAPVEEMAKAAALFLLFFWKRDEFDNTVDGLIYATMIGLGFAMTENVHWYAGAYPADELWNVVVTRGVLSPFSHPLFTGMTGLGLGVARETQRRWVKAIAPLVGLAAAIGLHMEWNGFAELGNFARAYVGVMLPTFIMMIVVVAAAQAREREVIRGNLRPYVDRGDLSGGELETLCRFGGRLRALWMAREAGGMAEWRRQTCFQQAASELAFHRWRTGRGISRGALKDAEREAEYLRILAENRLHRTAPALEG
jgi:RsiW-degrading membrane proteinase PrsW (M82 family)